MNKIDLKRLASIDDDFALWALEQATLLSEGIFDRLDVENLVEELDYLGNSQRTEIGSRLNVLVAHLLKWQFQPEHRSNSWRATLLEQRTEINRILKRSPSLKSYPAQELAEQYPIAVLKASGETGLAEGTFPSTCPYTIEQILDPAFLPD